jgi:ribosomal protein L12E/L44/L45/RPP1/RPP2
MTQDDYARKLDELDSLLNDPDVPMDPAKVWSLLADLSGKDIDSVAQRRPRPGAGSSVNSNGGVPD